MENEPNKKMGAFITQLRKENKLTQKEVAEYLGVTDKAVSKWERDLSFPDISLIIPMSKLFDVSTSELLSGEKKTTAVKAETAAIVEDVIVYTNHDTKMRLDKFKKIAFAVLTVSSMLGIGICFICDFSINKSLSWSYIVAVSVAFGWLLTLSFFQTKKHMIRNTYFVLSLSIFPYLFLLSLCLDNFIIFKLGAVITVISLIGLWCIYVIFLKLQERKLSAVGVSLLVIIPISIGINYMIPVFIEDAVTSDNTFSYVFTFFVAISCFLADYLLIHRKSLDY